jgi:alpha-1,6-mannosyltransferase
MTATQNIRVLIPAGIIFGLMLILHAVVPYGVELYAAVFLLSSAVYVWCARELLHAEPADHMVLILLGVALLVRATFLFVTPVGSDDVYRYLWDGKVQAAGINPYLYPPNAPELASLTSNLLPALVNHPEMKSVYFPVSQWIFYLSYTLAGESMWGFKLFLLLAESLTLAATWRLTRLLGVPRASVLLYALCPLPIIQFACDAHLDGLGLPLLAFALVYHLSQKRIPALLLLGASLAIKPVGLVLLPLLVLRERRFTARLFTLALPLVVFGLQFLPYWSTPHPFDGLLMFSRHWTFNGIAFETIDSLVADNLVSRLVCAGCLVVALLLLYWSSIRQQVKFYLAVLLLLLFSPVVHPWYICWLVLFLPLVRPWSGIIYAATASLTVCTVVDYKLTGVWEQRPLVLMGEYLPVLVALGRELWRERPGSDRR